MTKSLYTLKNLDPYNNNPYVHWMYANFSKPKSCARKKNANIVTLNSI